MQSLLTLALLVTSLHSLQASTYFVSTAGNDTHSGLSPDESFATLQHAANQIEAGDSVVVGGGSYVGFDLRNINASAQSPIVFIAPNQDVIINQGGPLRNDGINIEGVDHVEINGFQVIGMTNGGNGIRIVLSDHCIVRHCVCDQNDERGIFTAFTDDILIEYNSCSNSVDEHGIYVSNSSDRPTIRYNTCFNNNNIGIHMNGDLSAGGDGIISDAHIYGNIIFDNNLAAGINLDGCLNPLVYNNLIYNNHFGQGIACFQQDAAIVTQGALIYHNVIVVPDDGRWGILLRDGAHLNTDIKNNIIINQHSWRGCIATEGTQNFSSDYNILQDKMSNQGDGSSMSLADWQALGLDTNSPLMDSMAALFTDYTNQDFTPLASAQSVDAGTPAIAVTIDKDILGQPRWQGQAPDIGAYEIGNSFVEYKITLASDAIELNPIQASSVLTIEGDTNMYNIKILTPAGALYQDLSQEMDPILIQLNSLPHLNYLWHIESLTNPHLDITDDFN